MIGLLLRGFFLLTVVGWYSTSLWRMIDGYFKGQFQRYLEEEFRKNPKMREEMRGYSGTADKAASLVTEEKFEDVVRSCSAELAKDAESCAVGEADLAIGGNEESVPLANAFTAGAAIEIEKKEEVIAADEAQKEVDRLEEPTFRVESTRERDAEPPDEADAMLMDTILNDSTTTPVISIHIETTYEPTLQADKSEREQQSKFVKKRKLGGRPQIGAKFQKTSVKKNRHQPLTLTNKDFEYASRRKFRYSNKEGNVVDREFSEFDNDDSWTLDGDEDKEDKHKGIPISDLPYKPAVDIYDLDRLPEEEFCPLTLDEDPTCEATRPWP